MKQEHINYILSVEHYLHSYRKTLTMIMPMEDMIKVKSIYHEVMGSHIPGCSSCFIEHFTSLIIKAHSENIPSEEIIKQKALELASIADDEQVIKPKKRK